jgi:hypothetical protein
MWTGRRSRLTRGQAGRQRRHFCVGLLLAACSPALPERRVECTVTYGGEVSVIPVPLSAEPYATEAMIIARRFEFRPVLSADGTGARLLNVYTYGLGRAPTERAIIHQLKFVLPVPGQAAGEGRFGFTGRQFVYNRDARELQYWCALLPA